MQTDAVWHVNGQTFWRFHLNTKTDLAWPSNQSDQTISKEETDTFSLPAASFFLRSSCSIILVPELLPAVHKNISGHHGSGIFSSFGLKEFRPRVTPHCCSRLQWEQRLYIYIYIIYIWSLVRARFSLATYYLRRFNMIVFFNVIWRR